jgi:hypothetical protein
MTYPTLKKEPSGSFFIKEKVTQQILQDSLSLRLH